MRLTHACIWLAAGAILMAFTGCVSYTAPFSPPNGMVTALSAPLQTEFDSTQVYRTKGEASTLYFHDPILTGMSFAWDDCSVTRAARNGNLAQVAYADYHVLAILGVFGKMTITAYGPGENEVSLTANDTPNAPE